MLVVLSFTLASAVNSSEVGVYVLPQGGVPVRCCRRRSIAGAVTIHTHDHHHYCIALSAFLGGQSVVRR
jgi:hypothetical protein